MAFVCSPKCWQLLSFAIFSIAQSMVGIAAEVKSVTGEPRTSAVIRAEAPQHPPDIPLPAPQRSWKSSGHTSYYVDSRHGDQYGRGSKPRINARGSWRATVFLSNIEYLEVRYLDVANTGSGFQSKLNGVQIHENDFGTAHDIVLRDLYVHDVNGSNDKQFGGSGLSCECRGNRIKSRFDRLLVKHCHLVHTDRNGISLYGNSGRDHWYPSLHVVIRGNLLEDIGGDGIVPRACDGALVEHNIVRGCRMRAKDHAAGIWPWGCDTTVVQYNEVSGMKGTLDAEGYDSDYNSRGTCFSV
jgi:Right handed beta helix region